MGFWELPLPSQDSLCACWELREGKKSHLLQD